MVGGHAPTLTAAARNPESFWLIPWGFVPPCTKDDADDSVRGAEIFGDGAADAGGRPRDEDLWHRLKRMTFPAARHAQSQWSATPVADRKAIMLAFHDLVLERQVELLDIVKDAEAAKPAPKPARKEVKAEPKGAVKEAAPAEAKGEAKPEAKTEAAKK